MLANRAAVRDLASSASNDPERRGRNCAQDWKRLSALGAVDIANDRTLRARQALRKVSDDGKASWKGARGAAYCRTPHDAAFVRR